MANSLVDTADDCAYFTCQQFQWNSDNDLIAI